MSGNITPQFRQKRFAPKVRTGCVVCRERKIKCDEQRPTCRRCIIAERRCQYKDPKVVGPDVDKPAATPYWPNLAVGISRSLPTLPQITGSSDALNIINLLPVATGDRARRVNAELSWSDLILLAGRGMHSFMLELPSRAGHSQTLDAAVKCVSMALRLSMTGETNAAACRDAGGSIHDQYARALRCLQGALEDPLESRSANTLCSVILLSFYEEIRGHTGSMSVQHAFGTTRLIEHRGAGAWKTEFDKSLLVCHIMKHSTECLVRGVPSFLEHPAWQETIDSCIQLQPRYKDRSVMYLEFAKAFMPLLGTMTDTANYMLADHAEPAEREELLTRIKRCRDAMTRWSDQFAAAAFIPNTPKGSAVDEIASGQEMRADRSIELLLMRDTSLSLLGRLHLSLGGEDGLAFELAAQNAARNMLRDNSRATRNVVYGVRGSNEVTLLFNLCTRNAWQTLDTTEMWQEIGRRCSENRSSGGGTMLVSRDMFCTWLRSKGYPI